MSMLKNHLKSHSYKSVHLNHFLRNAAYTTLLNAFHKSYQKISIYYSAIQKYIDYS